MNFASDKLANGRRFQALNVVDDARRECVLQVVDLSIGGPCLTRGFAQLEPSVLPAD